MATGDFNGDKFPDIIVAGNDYSYDISTGYYDANKGFILLSRGDKQEFNVMTPDFSGLLFQGMAGSILTFEGDTTYVVAGFNREKTSVFKLNKTGN
jgi:hypothetical protein